MEFKGRNARFNLYFIVTACTYLLAFSSVLYAEFKVPIHFSKNRYVCVVSDRNSIEERRNGRGLAPETLLRKIRKSIRNLKLETTGSPSKSRARERAISLQREVKDCMAGRGRFIREENTAISSNHSNSSESGSTSNGSNSSRSSRPAHLILSENELSIGSDSTEKTFTLLNDGDLGATFQLSSSDAWVTINPASGMVGVLPQTINVTVDKTNLWLGTSTSSLRIVASDGTDLLIPLSVIKSGVPAPRTQVLSWLRELPPLPKKHFTWKPWGSFYADDNDDLLYEIIRINNGVTIADWPNAAHIDKVVRLCKQVNSTNPAIAASIAFVDSPFTTYWPAGAPPTYSGPERAQELSRHSDQMTTLASYLAAANARYSGPDIQLTQIAYDIELWRLKTPDESGYLTWNTAMRANYDALYDITKNYFPHAPIDWYSRGWIRFFGNHEPPAWATLPYYHFDLTEQGDTCSAVMYRLPMQNASREVFTRTTNYCAGSGVTRVIPWISLGAGYRPTDDDTNVYYTSDWNYDLQVSWNFGNQINNLSDVTWAPAEWVMIYPTPFQEESPFYAQHFIAYVRGAHGIPNLPR